MISSYKPISLLFGGNKLNTGVVKHFHDQGYDVVVVDWNETPDISGDLHLQIDIKDSTAIIAELSIRKLLPRVRMGYTSIDVAVPSLAHVLKICGLKVNSEAGLKNAFSKSRQTKIWQDAHILNRQADSYSVWDTAIYELVKGNKVIIKPDNAASSRGITVLNKGCSCDEAHKAFDKAIANATNNIVVVEEFVEGTEYTVEMLGDGAGNVAVYGVSKKYHTQNTVNNKIAVKLHYNAVSNELQRQISEVAISCYKALSFSCSLGHLEIIRKADGTLSPVEIGARSSGYIASDLVDAVSGRSYLKDLEQVYNGGSVRNGLMSQTNNAAMYYFYDIPAGTIIRNNVTLLDFCDKSIRSLASDTRNLFVGQQVRNINNDNERWGYEILVGDKKTLTAEHIFDAEQKMISAISKGENQSG